MSEEDELSFLDELDFDDLIPTNTDLTYSIVNNKSKPPYFCSCSVNTFKCRQDFIRHMYRYHKIIIPNKQMNKRKAEGDVVTDLTVKELSKYVFVYNFF